MTNKELQDLLKQHPDDMPVFIDIRYEIDGIIKDGTITGLRLDKNGCTDMLTWQKCDCITIEHV